MEQTAGQQMDRSRAGDTVSSSGRKKTGRFLKFWNTSTCFGFTSKFLD
jgi:hypothetical protein